ncbi:MAG TPA: prolyl oligopeptidase family serine peptidase, partial [Candidatus Acidoferrales bacterium]|nr:prolyl oligopeptidase family serine peptidase [Candidatus Acidoferrales bacterium]
MALRYRFAILCLLITTCCFPVLAQTVEGPGFDARPVEIPAAVQTTKRPVTSRDLLSLRDLHGVQISPDGKYVAFVVSQAVAGTNSYRTGLFVVGTRLGSKLMSLGTLGPLPAEHSDDPPQWSRDSRYVYHLAKLSSFRQVWRWTPSVARPVQITHSTHDIETFHFTSNGVNLLLQVKKPINPRDRTRLAQHGVLYDRSIDVVHWTSRPFLDSLVEAKENLETTWLHNLRNSREHELSEKERRRYDPWRSDPSKSGFIANVKLSPNGRRVAYVQVLSHPSESARYSYPLFSEDMLDRKPVALTPGARHIVNYWWTSDSQEIYYTKDNGDGHPFQLMRVSALGGPSKLVMAPSAWIYNYSADHQNRLAACTWESNTIPPQVAVVDLSTGDVRTLVDLNPEWRNLQLSSAQRLDISNKYGDSFHSELLLPAGYESGKRYPLVITTYHSGDNFLRGATGDEYPIQVFAANGFVVLAFDEGFERTTTPGDFDTAMLRWESPIEGMRAAIAELAATGIVDPSRVGITGLSYGAELVCYAISHTSLFQAAISSSSDFRSPFSFYIAGKQYQRYFADWGLGGWPEGESAKRWKQLSSTLNADRINSPLLINSPDSEYVPSIDLVTAVEQLGKPVELFIYPN